MLPNISVGDVPVEHNHQDTARGRERLKTGLGEAVGLQLPVLERPDQVLLLLNVTVQDGQVQITRSLVHVGVFVVGLEDICFLIRIFHRPRDVSRSLPWIMRDAQSKKTLDTLFGCGLKV